MGEEYGCDECGVSCDCCCYCEEDNWTPSGKTGQFDAVNVPVSAFARDVLSKIHLVPLDIVNPSASGGFFFPTLRNVKNKTNKKGKKNMAAKAASFKVVVKDGHEDYKFDAKSGQYKSKTVDYVEEFSDLAAALAEFFIYVADEYNEDKVSLVFVPGKKK